MRKKNYRSRNIRDGAIAVFIFGCLLVPVSLSRAQPSGSLLSPIPSPGVSAAPSSAGPAKKAYLTVLTRNQIHRDIITTIVVTVLLYLILFSLVGIINKRIRDIRSRHQARKNAIYLINFLLIITILAIWLQNINSITILLGFLSAGLALALQEVILSVAGWFLLITRRPFDTGDRVEINGIRGDVIDIRLFQTSLLEIGNWVDADQSTGRIVNIPNSFVYKHANYNYSRGFEFIWNEIPVLLTFESDWKRGREIILAIAEKMAAAREEDVQKKIEAMRNRYMIYYGKLTPIVYVNIKDSGIELTLRYLTEAKSRRYSQDLICRNILEAFAGEPHINFAYPTYRIVKE